MQFLSLNAKKKTSFLSNSVRQKADEDVKIKVFNQNLKVNRARTKTCIKQETESLKIESRSLEISEHESDKH